MDKAITRSAIVSAALAWIGTPYRHQGTRRGVGCDCLGLVRGVWRELYGEEPERAGAYARDWADWEAADRLLGAARRHFAGEMHPREAQAGDLLLFRWRRDAPARHLAIMSGPDTFIHAYEQAAVIESALVPAWRRRTVAAFVFPGVTD